MFKKETYCDRRHRLIDQVKSGIILIPGNNQSPINYTGNTFHFRQDSTFLYYIGIDEPGLTAVLDCESAEEILFGDDVTMEDIVWMGPQPSIAEMAKKTGIKKTAPSSRIIEKIEDALKHKRRIHFLPQYRHDNVINLSILTGINTHMLNKYSSREMILAVASQRSFKTAEEIEQIEEALEISYAMYILAMGMSKPGLYEHEVSGAVEGLVLSRDSHLSFPIIFSIHGETLHNHGHGNRMKGGDIVVMDSGAESSFHYASDITRTFPVSGNFSGIQKDIYQVVLDAQLGSIDMMTPGRSYKEIHLHAAEIIASGMKDLGFLRGDVKEMVAAGVHAIFFPHGLGHLLGLDVHDLENLGEDYFGYDAKVRRSDQFGLAYLRYAKALNPGLVLTVEPGIYFIPELIRQWKNEKKNDQYINYEKIWAFKDFGGIRIEDDVLITNDGHRVLGMPIPKSIEDVEAHCS